MSNIARLARHASYILLFCAFGIIAGCGGGGGSNGAGATPIPAPSALSYPSPQVFRNGTAIAPLTPVVSGTVTSYSVSPTLPAGLTLNTANGQITGTPTAVIAATPYLVTAQNGSGSSAFTLSIEVLPPLPTAPTGLSYPAPANLMVGTAITLNPSVTGTVDTYTVVPQLPLGLSLNPSTGQISGIPMATYPATNFTITAHNAVGWTSFALSITVVSNVVAPTALSYPNPQSYVAGAPIATLNPTVTGTVSSYSVTPWLPAGLFLNMTTGEISGTPTVPAPATTFTITASNVGGSVSFDLSITIREPAALSVSTQNMTFAARSPGLQVAAQSVTATILRPQELTGTLYVTVTEQGPAVATIGALTVSSQTFSGTATVTPATSRSLGAGTHTSTIRVNACLNSPTCTSGHLQGSPWVIDVTYTIDPFRSRHDVTASRTGVAFASMPGLSSLTRTLSIVDTLDHAASWSATDDAPWLTVTAAGVTPGSLVLTADPTGLAVDTIHYATVTVTSVEDGETLSESIRVGLWVGSQAPAATTEVALQFEELIVDPIRPYAYVHNGANALSIYHVYTGALVDSIDVGRPLGRMGIAHDGSRLFVGDPDSTGSTRITPINLADGTVGQTWAPLSEQRSLTHLEYVRVDGASLLFTGAGPVVNPATGTEFDLFGDDFRYNETIAASRDGKRICTLNRGLSPNTLRCFAVKYTDVEGDLLYTESLGSAHPGENGQDVAFSADGNQVYIASGAPYVFVALDINSLSMQPRYIAGDAYPNNVEVAIDGRLFAGASVWYDPTDVWIYSSAETLLRQIKISGYARSLLQGQLKLSSDGLRMITLSDDPKLQFTTAAP